MGGRGTLVAKGSHEYVQEGAEGERREGRCTWIVWKAIGCAGRKGCRRRMDVGGHLVEREQEQRDWMVDEDGPCFWGHD